MAPVKKNCSLLIVIILGIVISYYVDVPVNSSDATVAAGSDDATIQWRRTAHGWERLKVAHSNSGSEASASSLSLTGRRPSGLLVALGGIHPTVVSCLLLLISVAALLVFPAQAESDGRNRTAKTQ